MAQCLLHKKNCHQRHLRKVLVSKCQSQIDQLSQ